MANTGRRVFTVQLEGAPEDGGAVRLDDLQGWLRGLIETLAAVEREVSSEATRATVYRVVGMSCNSPVRVSIEAVPERGRKDYTREVIPRLVRETRQVIKSQAPPDIQTYTLEKMRQLAPLSNGRRIQAASISEDEEDEQVQIPPDFDEKISRLLKNVYRTYGSFRGRLQAINVRSTPSKLWIYPVAGPLKVLCTYRKGQFENLGQLLDAEPMVEVYGALKFRGDAPHPFEIELETITPLPEERELPGVDELAGSMPDITDGMDVVSYLYRLRDEEPV